MRENSTFYSKNLTSYAADKSSNKEEEKSPKPSMIQSLLNYSKSLEFKRSNHVTQVELVLN